MKKFLDQYNQYQKEFNSYLDSYLKKESLKEAEFFKKQQKQIEERLLFSKDLEDKKHYFDSFKKLKESMNYSLQGEGKRIRPVLTLAISEILGGTKEEALSLALALEMIHTYSLIHDDLPTLDNDDFRRGHLTNHKIFGEPLALLAGDALLTKAFQVLSENQRVSALRVINLLSSCAGDRGMVGGQVVDLRYQEESPDLKTLLQIHANKTGALFKFSALAPAILFEASEKIQQAFESFSFYLGLAFQISDDLLDAKEEEKGSFVALMGGEKTKSFLNEMTRKAIDSLREIPRSEFLKELVIYNQSRKK